MKKHFLKGLLVLLPCGLFGADLSPWYPRMAEIQTEFDYSYQTFKRVASDHHNYKYNGNSHFFTLSAGTSIFDWAGELELQLADTTSDDLHFDNVGLTGRVLFLSDTVGDPITLVAGATCSIVSKEALHDVSSFHHGRFEAVGHVAIGKEIVCHNTWSSHWWGVGFVGLADTGSPWLGANFSWENNWWDVDRLTFFVSGLYGFGGQNMRNPHHFEGYGPIHHRSVDVGFDYRHAWSCGQSLTLGYAYRAYAKNFPKNASTVTLTFIYPLGTSI